jgi:hypothetical protein
MRRSITTLATCALALWPITATHTSAAAADPSAPTVTVEPRRLNATTGQVLTIESVVANPGPGPLGRMIAHLNVASLDGRYVDLEDWSADVTRVVDPLPAGEEVSLEWEFQAVNSGEFDVYVTVLPAGANAGQGPVVAGEPVLVTVTARRALNSGGVLPVAIAVPALLALVAATGLVRARRTR